MRLVASTPHAVVLSPWRSSAAVEAWYGSTLEKVVQAMVLDVSYWIKVTYSKNENSIAMDETHEHYAGEFASKLREMGLHVKVENGVSKNREAAVADSLYKTFSAMASGSKRNITVKTVQTVKDIKTVNKNRDKKDKQV